MAKLPAEVKILGRTSKEAPDVLFWTGSRYEMNVKASYLTVHIEAAYGGQEQWIAVLVNKALICRMPLLRGENEILIFPVAKRAHGSLRRPGIFTNTFFKCKLFRDRTGHIYKIRDPFIEVNFRLSFLKKSRGKLFRFEAVI